MRGAVKNAYFLYQKRVHFNCVTCFDAIASRPSRRAHMAVDGDDGVQWGGRATDGAATTVARTWERRSGRIGGFHVAEVLPSGGSHSASHGLAMTIDGTGDGTGDGRAGGVVVRGRRRHGGAAYSGGGEGLRALTMCRRYLRWKIAFRFWRFTCNIENTFAEVFFATD